MFLYVSIVVLSCVGWTNFDSFNPHQVAANQTFVKEHPSECRREPPLVLDGFVTIEQCMSRAELEYMPAWLQRPENAHRIWLGAICQFHVPRDVIMGPIEDKP